MFSKFSAKAIIGRQIDSMKDYGTGKPDARELATLFAFPIVPAGLLAFYIGQPYSEGSAGIVISAASVFAALLLNLLMIVYAMIPAASDAKEKIDVSLKVEKDTICYVFHNISFAILISVLLILASFFAFSSNEAVNAGSLFATTYFGVQLLLSILQILKRFHSLLDYRLKRTEQ